MNRSVALPPDLATLIGDADRVRNESGESGASVHRITSASGDIFYLKHGVGRIADDVVDEAVRLRWLAGRLPCPTVRMLVCERDAAWILSDAVTGRTADEWLADEPERLPMIIRSLAGFMRRLHALPTDECPFDSFHPIRLRAARRNVEAGLVDEADFDEERLGRSAVDVLDEALRLAPVEPERVVTHGDFSLGNVLLDETGAVTGCIDVGRLGVADPYQDIAILWQNLSEFGEEPPRSLLRELGVETVDERRLLFHRCLDELF